MTGTAADRGGRADEHLRPAGRADPDQPADGPRRPGRPHLQDRGRQVRRRRRGHRRALRDAASRCSSARSRSRSPRSSSRMLEKRGIPHEVLNAKQHTREADDRRPGRPAARASPSPPTWPAAASTSSSAATPRAWPRRDVAGRGPRPRDRRGPGPLRRAARRSTRPRCKAEGDKVRELGGLYVLGTERHESRRIDNQLRGRSGRQGDPGESRFYLVARGRADAPVRHRRHELGDGQGPARRRADRGARWSPRPSSGRRTPSSSATPRSARTSSSTTR